MTFDSDDLVYSKIVFENIQDGDVVKWVYSGPEGLVVEDSLVMEVSGVAYAFAAIDMREYEHDSVTGTWTVTVDVNEVEVSSITFIVKSLRWSIPVFQLCRS